MTDYLLKAGIDNVWCNPNNDKQLIIKPARVSPPQGVFNNFKVMWNNYVFPTSDKYHVFTIGNINPLLLGLVYSVDPANTNIWYTLMDASNASSMITDIYTDTGIELPRHETYYTFGNNNDLILIIRDNTKIPINFTTDNIYLRVYSSAYFNTPIALAAGGNSVIVKGMTVLTSGNIATMQSYYNTYSAMTGYTKCTVNGFYKDNLNNIVLNDVVELIYDSSVYKYVELTLGSLPAFNSVLDNKRKYLIHYQNDAHNEIEFYDDNDIIIIDRVTGLNYGVYYHHNSVDSVRMVTHRDYSIVSDYVNSYIARLQINAGSRIINQSNIIVKILFKKSPYIRPIPYENNRIHDLYKLPGSLILSNLTGNGLPNWFAATLENSDYIKLMSAQYNVITLPLVESAIGYNASSVLLGNTPLVPYNYSSSKQVDIPYGLQSYSTAYEYDSSGYLFGSYPIANATTYICSNTNCVLVEIISGTGDSAPDVRLGINNITLPTNYAYRVYMCHLNTSMLPDNVWVDITGTTNYVVTNNVLNWRGAETNQYLMVRTDAKFLDYDISLPMSLGVFKFTLTELQNNGTLNNVIMSVPMGELDVFLNGKSLIPGLDYIFKFPKVVITNTSFLVNPNTSNQSIKVRYTGFCNSDLSSDSIGDTGFIVNGTLSADHKYNIRDDKVLRIVLNGGVKTRSSVTFAEDAYVGNTALNGLPYQVRDIVVPLKYSENIDTYSYRQSAQVIDTAVSNYLTNVLPQLENLTIPTITNKYVVSSPFLANIITDMKAGVITDLILSTLVADMDIIAIAKPYEFWLPFDLTQPALNINNNYVAISPTAANVNISLNLFQYRFLLNVIRLYCSGIVNVSQFITLV